MTFFDPKSIIYHDYGGSPENKDGVFNPYHVLVFPDGSVRYRNRDNPYGQAAPHAFAMNNAALGLSYAGPVGSAPTPDGMRALQQEYEKIQARYPGIPGMGHGEAFARYRDQGDIPRPSKLGRELNEGAWRNQVADLSRVPEGGPAPLSLLSDKDFSPAPVPGNAPPVPVAGLAPPTASPSAPPTTSPPPSPTGSPMPFDDATGKWIPEDVIKQQRDFASRMWDLQPSGKFSGLVGLLGGLGYGMGSSAANEGSRSNQDVQAAALQAASQAKDPTALARVLMGVPPLAGQGLNILAQSLDPAKKLALETGQFELGHKKAMAPTQEEMARVQLEQAKRKDWLAEYFQARLKDKANQDVNPAGVATPPPMGGAPSNLPGLPSGLPGTVLGQMPQPSASPQVPVATAAALPQATPTIPSMAPPPSVRPGLKQLFDSKTDAEFMPFMLAYQKDPEAAAKILQDWLEPDKKGREAGQVKLAQEKAQILADKPKNRVIASSVIENLDRMEALAGKIYSNKSLGFATGGWSKPQSTTAAITMPWRNTRPGSPTADVEADMHTLVSQVGFNTLQAMREASKTGGALGNVSEKELSALQNALTAIGDPSISKTKYRENLRLIQVYAKRVRQRTLGAWKDQYGEDFAEPGGEAPPSYANPAPSAAAGPKADPLGIRQ